MKFVRLFQLLKWLLVDLSAVGVWSNYHGCYDLEAPGSIPATAKKFVEKLSLYNCLVSVHSEKVIIIEEKVFTLAVLLGAMADLKCAQSVAKPTNWSK